MDPFKGIYSEQFVCAADYSSRLDTLYYENVWGVPRYGIFQLSGLEWCDNGRHPTQNRCNVSCDLFLDDDIQDDTLCVKKIVQRTKDMRAWPLYLKYCNKQTISYYYMQCLFGKNHGTPKKRIRQKTRTLRLAMALKQLQNFKKNF
ncbi:lysozyme C, milk isozyme-like [Notechis scutatus]|uniref:lysozyme n=1 Tax=Notechis scutatus TaxID=8663 RepID=A0A6J1V9K0_9SAUR|nr:lysozyme C, milk isozyme-like [Notechis scutatus]